MKTIDILGENRFEVQTKTREACRAIVIHDEQILLTYTEMGSFTGRSRNFFKASGLCGGKRNEARGVFERISCIVGLYGE